VSWPTISQKRFGDSAGLRSCHGGSIARPSRGHKVTLRQPLGRRVRP